MSELTVDNYISEDEYYSSPEEEDEELQIKQICNKDITHTPYTIVTIYNSYLKRQSINLQPAYQRDISWSHEKMLLFLDSIFYCPIIPSFILYKLSSKDLKSIREKNPSIPTKYECIDGQHRLTVIDCFMNSKPIKIGEKEKYLYIIDKKDSKTKLFYSLTDDIKKKFNRNIRELNMDEKQDFEETQLSFQIINKPMDDLSKRNMFNRLQNGEKVSAINKLKNIEHPITNYLRENNIITTSQFDKWKHIIEGPKNIYSRTGANQYMNILTYFIIRLLYITDLKSLNLNSRYIDVNVTKTIKNNTEASKLKRNIDYLIGRIEKNRTTIENILKGKKISCEFYFMLHYLLLNNNEGTFNFNTIIKNTKNFNTFNKSKGKDNKTTNNDLMNKKYKELIDILKK